jgi:hypothetical protein
MDRAWRFIEIVAAHPFEAAVVAFAVFFVLSIFAIVGITHWRSIYRIHRRTGLLLGQLPPPEDRRRD